MSAGRGVAHAEEHPAGRTGRVHGVQLWVAQPEATRHGEPAFQHLASLPQVEVGDGVVATVLVGALEGAASAARVDTPLLGTDVVVAGSAVLPLDVAFEHAVVVVEGTVAVDGTPVSPGVLAALAVGRDELHVAGSGRILLLGGVPLGEQLLMWWNFVARTPDEVDEARRDWEAGHDRFGVVDSRLARIPAPARRLGG
jgi:redox-sensitive bicupin YhaK (pirin superfamily)